MTLADPDFRNAKARDRLLQAVPEPMEGFDRAAMIEKLPMILEAALDLILDEVTVKPGMTNSAAVGCRILAVTIDRLRA